MRTVIIILCFVFILYICIIVIKNVFKKKLNLSVNLTQQDGDTVKMSILDLDDNDKTLFEVTLIPDKTFTKKDFDNTYSLQDNIVANLLSDNNCIFNFPNNIINTKRYIIAVCTKATIEDYILHFFFSWFSEDRKYIIYCSDAEEYKGLFYYSPATEIEIISCGSEITDMSWMFSNCRFVKKINCKKLVTNKVTDMSWMFYTCNELEELNLENFDTSSVTDMFGMFDGCSSLKELNISSFNTSNVTNMEWMFAYCSGLTELNLSKFNTKKVTSMRGMFLRCTNLLELDLSSFNTDAVEDMRAMFSNCSSLTKLNLYNFFFLRLKWTISEMFLNCNDMNIICSGNTMGQCHGNQAIGAMAGINVSAYETSAVIYNFYCKKGSNNHLYVIRYYTIL